MNRTANYIQKYNELTLSLHTFKTNQKLSFDLPNIIIYLRIYLTAEPYIC